MAMQIKCRRTIRTPDLPSSRLCLADFVQARDGTRGREYISRACSQAGFRRAGGNGAPLSTGSG